MNESESLLSADELELLRKQVADREAKTAAKVDKLLTKERDLTASDIKWLLGKEVDRRRIAKAMKMSISTLERYLSEHGLVTKSRTKIEPEIKAEIKNLLKEGNLTRKEIAKEVGVSYSTVAYQHNQMTEECESMAEQTAKDLNEQISILKQELEQHQKAIGTLKADRQGFYERLQQEQSKVKERDKLLKQLNRDVQRLIQERDDLLDNSKKENLQKQHDLLLEYIRLGGST
ncbi:winged helix-turn-helix transcriptional regulator [Oceanobacillus sp. CFH 90083]|uniref:winged helix-turn-helix transcriptional regulator n=1 Tax=Oceanobacillus sp. CFH 90083 TaxID=2592336 RepID=UPI00128B8C75|nr:winged helix-turn-helix transcriptional regulator [Oceanobacillus sp. CFH 90083]